MSSDPISGTAVTRIGRYDVIGELGRGGMGVVYHAEDKLIGREVAIKTLTETTPELHSRFYIEARSGILNHPNIVTVYELGEHEGNPYIAMEFVAGKSLEKILRSNQRLSLLETLSIIEQLCSALGYAHQNGVQHRDIKPANVIVQPDGKIKIVDFGIARLADQATRLTKTDALIGTFHYIAPERLKGQISDGRSDIWSVGVMLYEMITGEVPFKGQDVSALYKVIHEPYTPLSNFVENLPEALGAVVDRALAKNPQDRYSTAEEMAFDLQSISEEQKKERVGDLIVSVRRLLEQRQYTSARTLLYDLQRIDPQNIEAKRLMRDVQDELGRLQKAEQVRQIVDQAENAILSQRYDDAVSLYIQAIELDVDNTLRLDERLDNARRLKENHGKIRTLWQQAGDARGRGDLISAQSYLSRALELDDKNTDLRNAYLTVLREIEQHQKEDKLNLLLQAAREEYSSNNYQEAIARLREAAEIDPIHPEVQKLLHEASARQEEEHRRLLLEQIIAEIHESLYREDYERALNQLNRTLEKLPSEASLLRLKAETEKKRREFQAQQTVQYAAQRAQDIFFDDPQEALKIVESALRQVEDDDRLIQLKLRLEDHLRRVKQEELLARYMKQAHAEIDALLYKDAIQTLEAALIDCGASDDLNALLEFAREEQQTQVRRQQSNATREEAQVLIRTGQYEAAITMLEPLAKIGEDSSAKTLLEQARKSLEEVTQRAEAVASHTRSLAITNLSEALRLIDSQPPEIAAHSHINTLKQDLKQKAEVDSAIQKAIGLADNALTESNLVAGMDPFEAVRRAYGSSPALIQAIDEFEKKRSSIANSIISTAIDAARKAFLRNEGKTALETLRRSADAWNFADTELQSTWKQLLEEAAKAAGMESHVRKDSLSIIVQEKSRTGIYVSVGLLCVAIAVAVGIWRLSQHSALNSSPVTYLEINASPWAVVQRVTNDRGRDITLPGTDRSTPLRLDGVPIGSYRVVFKGMDGANQVQICQLTMEQHLCMVTSVEPDIKQLLTGDQP
jgi:eukaryotic-like serine/threonine-protein kinase